VLPEVAIVQHRSFEIGSPAKAGRHHRMILWILGCIELNFDLSCSKPACASHSFEGDRLRYGQVRGLVDEYRVDDVGQLSHHSLNKDR